MFEGKKKPHIKKPLNAFMLYMKEMRPKVRTRILQNLPNVPSFTCMDISSSEGVVNYAAHSANLVVFHVLSLNFLQQKGRPRKLMLKTFDLNEIFFRWWPSAR